jgi:hypothetical protein
MEESNENMENYSEVHLEKFNFEETIPEYNLILDLDGTLISVVEHNKYHLVKARPHLSYFMHYIFSAFKRVSIWTNASTTWYNYCYNNILAMHMPPGAKFDLVITADNGIIEKKMKFDLESYLKENDATIEVFPRNLYVKNLEFLYELYPEYHSTNTYILDDMPFTYSMNKNNAIPISQYEYDDDIDSEFSYDYINEDNELIRVVYQIKMVLFGTV